MKINYFLLYESFDVYLCQRKVFESFQEASSEKKIPAQMKGTVKQASWRAISCLADACFGVC